MLKMRHPLKWRRLRRLSVTLDSMYEFDLGVAKDHMISELLMNEPSPDRHGVVQIVIRRCHIDQLAGSAYATHRELGVILNTGATGDVLVLAFVDSHREDEADITVLLHGEPRTATILESSLKHPEYSLLSVQQP